MNYVVELAHVLGKRERTKENARSFSLGVLVSIGGSVSVAGRPDYVWVREFNEYESVSQVLNRTVQPVAGSPVKIGRLENKPFERAVLGAWDRTAAFTDYTEEAGQSLSSTRHNSSHEWKNETNFGSDVVRVYAPAIQPLKVMGDGATLTVSVNGGNYFYRGTARSFAGGYKSLSSSVPGTAGQSRYALVYLNANNNAVTVVNGTATTLTPTYPDIPVAAIPLAFVLLTNAQTAITTSTHVVDARMFVNSNDEVISELGDLLDVTITSAADGDFVRRNGAGEWVNETLATVFSELLGIDGAGSGLDADTLDGKQLTDLNLRTYTFSIPSPAVGGYPGLRVPQAWTVTRIDGYSVGATSTASVNVEKRTTPGSAGTNILGSELSLTTTGASDAAPSSASISSGTWLWLDVSAIANAPSYLVVTVTATV